MGQADASDYGPLTSRERFKGATRSIYSNQSFDSEQACMKNDSVKTSKRSRDGNTSWDSHPNNIRSFPAAKTPISPSSSSLSLPPCTQHQNAVAGHERPRRNTHGRSTSACLHILMCSFATCLLLIALVQISTTNSFLSHVVMAQRPRRWPMLRTPFQDLLFGSSSDPNRPSDSGSGSATPMLGSVSPASKDGSGGSSSKRHYDAAASPDGSSTSYRNAYPKESSSSNGDGSYSTSAKIGKGKGGADKSDPKQMDLELSASEKRKDNQEFILYSENADADSQNKNNNSNGSNKGSDSKSPSSSPAPAPAPSHPPSSGKSAPALPSSFKVPPAKATQSGPGPGLDASDLGKSNVKKGDWVRSRSTYYGGPDFLSTAYDPTRGKGSFGILSYGSCGYTNSDGSLPFPEDAVAAPADSNPDYPGSCGRCYLLKCVNGVVYANSTSPVRIIDGYFDGDYSRPYLPSINPNIKDTLGRSWPGNSMETDGLQSVKCWDENKILLVRLIDSCPCRQVLSDKAPGVKKGGEVRRQEWCCGGQQHFDISYWAFEKLAHPVYGVMTVDMRPVDCNSQEALQFLPGYISEDIYRNGMIQPGWDWFPYSASYSQLSVAGGGYGGRKGTCMTLSPGGGLKLLCRECQDKGYQPFKDADNIEMWIRPNSKTSDPFESSTPQGSIPPLKIFLLNDHEPRHHCKNEVVLNATASSGSSASIFVTKKDGGWFHIMVPISLFNCGQDGTASLDILERMDFQNINGRNAMVCFDKIRINKK